MAPHHPEFLLEKLNFSKQLIAVYDAPASTPFYNIVTLKPIGHVCLFTHYKNWMNGKTLKLTDENFGCGGCGKWLFSKPGRDRQSYIEFLADDEGLKANHELMGQWFDNSRSYRTKHDSIFVGPYNPTFMEYIKTVTFFVNPDQLSTLIIGAHYFASPSDPKPVSAPFGSGCMELLPLFDPGDHPQAIIGTTDVAMRKYIPADVLAFTVNMPMYENLCSLDETSFLNKPFLEGLKKSRGGKIEKAEKRNIFLQSI